MKVYLRKIKAALKLRFESFGEYLTNKNKDVVTKLSKSQMISCVDVVSSLEMKVLPKSVDDVVTTLNRDAVAAL